MAQEFRPEFIEVVLYEETKILGNERIRITITQHHNYIFMIKLAHWNYDTEEDINFIRQLIYSYDKNKIIRAGIMVLDQYVDLCVNDLELAKKTIQERLNNLNKE
jgi:hypothetical protein